MEKPFYGRTGLLDSGRDGVPVQKARLLPIKPTTGGAAPIAPTLRWAPTMLTAPQRLLNHLAKGHPVDASIVSLLRLGSMGALLRRALGLDRSQTAALNQHLLRWHRGVGGEADKVGRAPPDLSWYLPDYKVVIVKGGASIGTLGDLSQRSLTLLGKDRELADVALDHPSCSSQHAALEVSFVLSPPVEEDLAAELAAELRKHDPEGGPSSALLLRDEPQLASLFLWLWERLVVMQKDEYEAVEGVSDGSDDGDANTVAGAAGISHYVHGAATFWSLELLLIDLGSTNGTTVNGTRLASFAPTPLIEGDVVAFGASSRQYVVMRAGAEADKV